MGESKFMETFILKSWDNGRGIEGVGLKRAFLAARGDLVKRLSELVAGRHQKLYGVVNEVLEQTLRVYRFGKDLAEVVDDYEVLMASRRAGYILISRSLLNPILEDAYLKLGDKLIRAWYEHGVWLGNYLSAKFSGQGFIKLEGVMQAFLWEASEFRLTESDGGVSLRYISPASPLSYTTLLASFLEGLVNAYGPTTVRKEVSKGVISIDFSREGNLTRGVHGV